MKSVRSKNYIMQYIICTYGLFGVLLLTLGGVATKFLKGTPLTMRWLTAITAWTSTYVLLLMFKKLFPASTVKTFFRNVFSERLNVRLLAIITCLQLFVFIASVYLVSVQVGTMAIDLFNFSFTVVIPALFFTLIQGSTGEEPGWRGYLLPAVSDKIGVVKGALVVSILWSFWHAPIWFLSTGYSGLVLMRYITVFVICTTSLGFIMSISYHHCKNLFVPIWIHFLFNFFGETYIGSMVELVTWYAALYLIMAVGFYIWHKRNCERKTREPPCALE